MSINPNSNKLVSLAIPAPDACQPEVFGSEPGRVLNRGNGRMRIFHKNGDYLAFQRVLAEGLQRYPVERQ
jgi:hypothetical protein